MTCIDLIMRKKAFFISDIFVQTSKFFSNLDPLTETYGLSFYMQYLAHWPEYFQVAESPSGEIMGYSKFCKVYYNMLLNFFNF